MEQRTTTSWRRRIAEESGGAFVTAAFATVRYRYPVLVPQHKPLPLPRLENIDKLGPPKQSTWTANERRKESTKGECAWQRNI